MTYCAGVSPLLATPTTSASVRLWHDARCRPAAFEILFQKGDGKWHSHEQIGWSLPFELGSLVEGAGEALLTNAALLAMTEPDAVPYSLPYTYDSWE